MVHPYCIIVIVGLFSAIGFRPISRTIEAPHVRVAGPKPTAHDIGYLDHYPPHRMSMPLR
jgi:hypothetical protein